jgi:hypothetical protein
MANESEVPAMAAEQLEQPGAGANCSTKSIRADDMSDGNPHSNPTTTVTNTITRSNPTLLESAASPPRGVPPTVTPTPQPTPKTSPPELSDWAAVQREFDEKDFDTNSVNTSNYTWNSDDKPPEESKGLQTNCTADNLVSKTVLAPGKEETRPGGLDRVCIGENLY